MANVPLLLGPPNEPENLEPDFEKEAMALWLWYCDREEEDSVNCLK